MCDWFHEHKLTRVPIHKILKFLFVLVAYGNIDFAIEDNSVPVDH